MFILLATILAGGVAVGLVRGGSLFHAVAVTVPPWVPVAFVAAGAVQVVVVQLPPSVREVVGWPLLVAAGLVATLALVATLRSTILRRAALVALLGCGLNAAVMLPNGGMPVSAEATRQVGFEPVVDERDPLARHVHADHSTSLPFLGDVIPLRFGPERGALSAGDLVLLAAVAFAAHDVVTGRAAQRAAHPARTRREV